SISCMGRNCSSSHHGADVARACAKPGGCKARTFSCWMIEGGTHGMGPFLAYSRAMDKVSGAFGWVADWMVLLACLISAGNATMRYTINYSSNAWLEVQWYLFAGI